MVPPKLTNLLRINEEFFQVTRQPLLICIMWHGRTVDSRIFFSTIFKSFITTKKVKLKIVISFIKKETLAQVFSCEYCLIFKNTFFHRTPLVVASRPYGLRFLIQIKAIKSFWNMFEISCDCMPEVVFSSAVKFFNKFSLNSET